MSSRSRLLPLVLTLPFAIAALAADSSSTIEPPSRLSASLRAKLPEELKELETFRLAEDSEAMNVALSKVKARLRARLSGEDGI